MDSCEENSEEHTCCNPKVIDVPENSDVAVRCDAPEINGEILFSQETLGSCGSWLTGKDKMTHCPVF